MAGEREFNPFVDKLSEVELDEVEAAMTGRPTPSRSAVSEELKACPFCDGPTFFRRTDDVAGCYHVGKPHCPVGRWTMTVEQWNHRPTPDLGEDRERLEQVISAWAFAHDIDGAARNDLFRRLESLHAELERGEKG